MESEMGKWKIHSQSPISKVSNETICGKNLDDFNHNEIVSSIDPPTCKKCIKVRDTACTITSKWLVSGKNIVKFPEGAQFLSLGVGQPTWGKAYCISALVNQSNPIKKYEIHLISGKDYFDNIDGLKFIATLDNFYAFIKDDDYESNGELFKTYFRTKNTKKKKKTYGYSKKQIKILQDTLVRLVNECKYDNARKLFNTRAFKDYQREDIGKLFPRNQDRYDIDGEIYVVSIYDNIDSILYEDENYRYWVSDNKAGEDFFTNDFSEAKEKGKQMRRDYLKRRINCCGGRANEYKEKLKELE